MNEIEKLFRKISKDERKLLMGLVEEIVKKNKNLNIKKMEGGDFYRLRKGRFRIIFHYGDGSNAIIDSIRLKNERTYKDF